MILKFIKALDIGYLGKQRLLFCATDSGNLAGHHILQGGSYLHSFPNMEVQRGDYVVLYIKDGETHTQDFHDATCHFLYYGKQLRLWEDEENRFTVVYHKT